MRQSRFADHEGVFRFSIESIDTPPTSPSRRNGYNLPSTKSTETPPIAESFGLAGLSADLQTLFTPLKPVQRGIVVIATVTCDAGDLCIVEDLVCDMMMP